MKALADKKECHPGPGPRSDVVLETKVLDSRRLEDKNTSLGLGLGLEIKVLVLILVLTKSLEHFQAFFAVVKC